MTIQITLPTGVGLAPRYGPLFGQSGFMDQHGVGYLYPHMGGDISQSRQIDMYRYTILGENKGPKNGPTYKAEWEDLIDKAIGEIYKFFIKRAQGNDPVIKIVGNQVTFRSTFDLERILNDDIWRAVVVNLYEKFPKAWPSSNESYYVPAFMGGSIPWTFIVENNYECFISTPTNSIGGLTRIRYNKGVWQGWKNYQKFKTKIHGPDWEYLYKLYSDSKMKVTTTTDIINFLNHRTFNPMEYKPVSNGQKMTFSNMAYIIMNTLNLRLFELTRQQLDLPDWKISTKYESIMRNVSDEQVARAFTVISDTWNNTQIKVPVGDLPSVSTLMILPIELDNQVSGKCAYQFGFDKGAWLGEPRLNFCQVRVNGDDSEEELEESNGKLRWVRIKTINAAESEEYVTYHRTFGTYHGSSLDKEANFIINQIAPLESYTIKPVTVGMKLEPRHWKIVFDAIDSVNPITTTANSNIHYLFNQKSQYGPKFYLPDIDGLQDVKIDGAYISEFLIRMAAKRGIAKLRKAAKASEEYSEGKKATTQKELDKIEGDIENLGTFIDAASKMQAERQGSEQSED